jgi:hypothetical protein
MDSLTAEPVEAMPHLAASFSASYPKIRSVEIPETAPGIMKAWGGIVQPFSNDETARRFLRAMEDEKPVNICDGEVIPVESNRRHWADPLLVGMNQLCRVMVLEPTAPAHPHAYLLDPAYDLAFLRANRHPHSRWDRAIKIDGRQMIGLCIYSAAEFIYLPNVEKSTQFMDQLLLYVARHLIWLRTRRLYRMVNGAETEVYVPRPGERIDQVVQHSEFWKGLWVGRFARFTTPAGHFANIRPEQECWCGSGIPYGLCHRPKEGSAL